MSPVIPFGPANYILGLTSIRLPSLMFVTFLGNLPGAISYSVIGSFIGDLSSAEGGDTGINMIFCLLILSETKYLYHSS